MAVAFGLLLLDNCLRHGEPEVRLPGGYVIGATNSSEPCSLWWRVSASLDVDAVWIAEQVRSQATETNRADVAYSLYRRRGEQFETFTDARQFHERARAVHAVRKDLLARLSAVDRFGSDGRTVVGTGDGGSFILDTVTNDMQTFALRADWARAVRAQTTLNPDLLDSPRALWLQYRSPFTLGFLIVAAVLGFVWATGCRRRAPTRAAAKSQT